MRSTAILCLMIFFLPLAASAGPELPDGYVAISTQKYVWLCAKGKNGLTLTQKAEILEGLKQITDRYEKLCLAAPISDSATEIP